MLKKFLLYIRKHIMDIDDRSQLEIGIENGLTIGKNCHIMDECILDPGHCWLIEIGDRVTLAPRVHILAHDASTKRPLGKTVLGKVKIGNDVFIGAGTIVLPHVVIGDKVIVGAGSVVSRDIPINSVAVGNPARVICTYDEYIAKRQNQMSESPCYDISYTLRGAITLEKKEEMKTAISRNGIGFVE